MGRRLLGLAVLLVALLASTADASLPPDERPLPRIGHRPRRDDDDSPPPSPTPAAPVSAAEWRPTHARDPQNPDVGDVDVAPTDVDGSSSRMTDEVDTDSGSGSGSGSASGSASASWAPYTITFPCPDNEQGELSESNAPVTQEKKTMRANSHSAGPSGSSAPPTSSMSVESPSSTSLSPSPLSSSSSSSSSGSTAGSSGLIVESLSGDAEKLCAGSGCVGTTEQPASSGSTAAEAGTAVIILGANVIPSIPGQPAGVPPGIPSTTSPVVETPYRSTYCRCRDSECQNEFPGGATSDICEPQYQDGTCPVGFSKCVGTSSYKVQISPTTPNSVADVTFSLLASDIAGAFHNLGDQNPVTSGKNWWLAFRLPSGWRFVSWASTIVRVQVTNSTDATASFMTTFQLHPCTHVTHKSNCQGTVNTDNVGFVSVKNMLQDWQSISALPDMAPLTFKLEQSVVSGPLSSSGQVEVYLVYERNAAATTAATTQNRRMTVRELYVTAGSASSGSTSTVGVSGNLTAVALANMQAPAIDKGRLYSSLLWIEVQKRKATLSFSTSTVIGRTSNNPKVCINLRPSACSLRGRTPSANLTFTDSPSAAYVKEGNPFLKYYVTPGDASLSVEQVNDTYFCVDKLLPTGVDPVSTWEISKEFTFQLYVQGILWANGAPKQSSMSAGVPTLAEIALIDRGVVQGTDCAQLIVHDQTTSNHGLSVYSVMSVTIYSVSFVGAVLITRMNGITFSALTFYNDMTSVSVIIIFLLSIVGNTIWINVSGDVQTTNASHIYYLTRILASCFTWTMMVSVCFHWTTVLYHDVRKFRRVYLMLIFMIFNIGFFGYGLFALISMSDFFKCAYDDYLKNPKYDRRMCDTDYCPDLQPSQWKYAAQQICKAVPYSNWYFATAYGTEIMTFLASLALLVLGTYVLRRGSRLIEHSGNLLDDRVVAVMRNSLKTYLFVILAITISLGLATLINLILYTSDWSMNAIVWYTLTIWLPTVIPPAGFLILQWNPRLHGISWNHSSAAVPSKDRRDTKEDQAKRALGRISTFGRLSEGWAGITDFPDTDYLPIGAETNQGCQQLLTLSAQLATPVTIAHACYMELYVGEADSNDVTGMDFDFGLPGRPRGSVSAMIQTGLLRESMIVQRKTSRSDSTLLQSMATSNLTWTRMGCTETVLPMLVQSSGGPSTQVATFMSTLQIPVMPPTAVFRFVVYEIPDSPLGSPSSAASDADSTDAAIPFRMTERAARASISGMSMAPPSRPRVFCEFSCPASQFVNTDQVQLVAPQGSHRVRHFSSASVDNEAGQMSNPVLRIRSTTVSTRTLKDGNGFYITKCFQFMDGDDMVVEDMTETIFTNEIPRQFLDLLQKERAQDLARAEHDLQAFEEKCRRGLAAGLYDNLIDQIQGENVQTVAQSWLEERCRTRSAYVEAIKECQLLCVDRAEEGLNFKASTEKKSLQLRFLPINLHVQDMWVGPTSELSTQLSRRTSERIKLYTGVTVGAFAAHCFKFRHGAGVLSMRSRLVKHLGSRAGSDKMLLNRNDSGLSDKSQPGVSDQEYDWTHAETRSDDDLKWQIVMRMDMCLSQAMTALVTSFCRNLEAALQHPTNKQFLYVIDSIGFLWQVESLLSTQGKELGMLEDFYAAVEAMKGVTFVLDMNPPAHLPPTLNLHIKDVDLPSVVSARLSGDTKSGSYKIVIGVRCSKEVLTTIPSGIRSGRSIPVTSVLFTQGINEMQTLANGSSAKKTTLQQTINHDSFFVLKEYVEKYKKFAANVTSIPTADMTVVGSLLEELEDRIVSASKQMVKTKHPKIIQQSSRLCRMLSAGRVTSCKSAKDRTSMSVTLEQGELLCEHHGLPADSLVPTVSTMRSNGVRIENAYKNTGKRQYAFNALQRSLLPEEYKCPEGTYGRGNVS